MLKEIPSYDPETQVSITRAAGVLHNFVRVCNLFAAFLMLHDY